MKRIYAALLCSLCTVTAAAQVRTGIDVLEDQHFAPLKELAAKHGGHLNIGILTNPVGIDSQEKRTIDVLRQDAAAAVPGLKVLRLFSAEHGINATSDNVNINDQQDTASGLPIFGIFGATAEQRHPSAKQTEGLDAVVIDLQDVGVRYWTFTVLMQYFLQASAANKYEVIVLDRPNPIGGVAVQGPVSSPGRENYTNPYPEPIRPGMTMGELAEFFNGEMHIGAHLTVIKMTGWKRSDYWDNTNLLWVNPSPNVRTLTQSIVYAGTGIIEGTNVNIKGPGEPPPFVRFGAPWIKATELAKYLNARNIPGVSFVAMSYVPSGEEHYPFRGQRVEGVEIVVNDRLALDAPELGVEAVSALWKLYPNTFQIDKVDRLLVSKDVLAQIKEGKDPRAIAEGWQPGLNAYKAKRAKYLLYQ